MGYSNNGNDYWPDDDENTIYIRMPADCSIESIAFVAGEQWGDDCDLNNVEVSAEHIKTSSINGGGYDPTQWTTFIVLRYIPYEETHMHSEKISVSISDILAGREECPLPLDVIPNQMGINLCSVDSVSWERQADGQLVNLTIHFIPS